MLLNVWFVAIIKADQMISKSFIEAISHPPLLLCV